MRFTAIVTILASIWSAGLAGAGESVPPADGIKPLFGENDGKAQIDLSTPDGSSAKINFPQRPETFDSLLGRKPFSPMPPTPMPPPPSRRSQESIDQKNNWAFFTPEDVINTYMAKETMKLPEFTADGRDKKTLSAVERYYERMARGRQPGTGSRSDQSQYDLFGQQDAGEFGFGKDTDGLIDLKSLGKMSGDLSSSAFDKNWNRPNTMPDLTGSRNVRSLEDLAREKRAQQDQLDAFRRALEYRNVPTASADTPLTSLTPGSLPSGGAIAPSLPVPSNPYLSGSSIFAPPAAPSAPTVSLPPAYQAPWQNDPTASLPIASPARTMPPKLDFSPPQRKF